jgi:PAS domain S-box-containing protein
MALPYTFGRSEGPRLRALEQYLTYLQVPGAVFDPELESIVRLAADICAVPSAGISLVGADQVDVIARFGYGPRRFPRSQTPCERCIQHSEIYEIKDARHDPAFRPDGILMGGRAYRFYAGAPLVTPDGYTVGCLFVQSAQPQTLNPRQRTALTTLSRQVITRFELGMRLNVKAYQDPRNNPEQDRRRVETALTVERNFVSTVLDTVGALVAVFDTAGRIVRFNRTCETVSGYEFSMLVGQYFWERLIPPDEVEEAIAEFDRLRSGDFPAAFENNWQHRDGSVRRIAWTATGLLDAQDQPAFLIATGIDITDQRAAEITLRESEARYRQLVEGALGIICTHSLDGTVLSVNANGAQLLGRTVEEMVQAPLTAFMVPSQRAAFDRYLHEVAAAGEAESRLELAVRTANRSAPEARTFAFRNKLIDLGEPFEPYVLAFGVDISEQVRAEEKLRALIHQSNSILESVGDGIYGIDLHGNLTVVNPAAAQMLGYRPEELMGRNLHELVHHSYPDGSPYPEADCPITSTARTGETVRIASEVFWRKDGTSFPVEYVARPQIDTQPGTQSNGPASGRPRTVGVVVAFRDTSERQALDRMKDEFISTVSHELRTPLTSIRAALGLVIGGALESRPEKRKQMLEVATSNTDRLIKLVNDFLEIERVASGNAELHATVGPIQPMFERAIALQQPAAEKANIRFDLKPNNVSVYADPDRILQALTNLISNAIKFSPANTTITLAAHPSKDGHEATITVSDEGRGIPADKLETVFERFQQGDASDSRALGGTGLGLAICRSIIHQHSGRIWATSEVGKGSTFHFTLPTSAPSHLR